MGHRELALPGSQYGQEPGFCEYSAVFDTRVLFNAKRFYHGANLEKCD
jgi:hypothetical protein